MTVLVVVGLIAFVVGFIFAGIAMIGSGDIVIVRGKKDSFQTVEFKDKNYRLVELDKASGHNE